MNCPTCGTANLDNSSICANCGRPLSAPPPPPPPSSYTPPPPPRPSPGYGAPAAGETVPNYLVQSILVTLCCCLPLGIVAIIFAADVNSKLSRGDYAGARAASNNAKKWSLIGLVLGIVLWIVLLLIYGLAIVQAVRQGSGF